MYKHIVTNLSICIAKPVQLLLQDQTLTSSAETLCPALLQLWGLHKAVGGCTQPLCAWTAPGGFGNASPIDALARSKSVEIPRK